MKTSLRVLLTATAFYSACFLFSCKVTTYTFKPKGEIFWSQGKDYQFVYSRDSVEIQSTFLVVNNSEVKFNMRIYNHSSVPFNLDPTAVYLRCKDTIAGNYRRSYGKDPEIKLNSLANEIRHNESKAKTTKGESAGTLTELLYDVSGKEMPKSEKERYAREREQAAARNATVRDQARSNLMLLDKEKYYWEHETLRKNTLFKGDNLQGDIYFSLQPNARNCAITVHTPADTLYIPYQQISVTH